MYTCVAYGTVRKRRLLTLMNAHRSQVFSAVTGSSNIDVYRKIKSKLAGCLYHTQATACDRCFPRQGGITVNVFTYVANRPWTVNA